MNTEGGEVIADGLDNIKNSEIEIKRLEDFTELKGNDKHLIYLDYKITSQKGTSNRI